MPIPRFQQKQLRCSVGIGEQLQIGTSAPAGLTATTTNNIHGNLAEDDPGEAWNNGWALGPITSFVSSPLVRVGRLLHISRPLLYVDPALTPPVVGTTEINFTIAVAITYASALRTILVQSGDGALNSFFGTVLVPYCPRIRVQFLIDNTGGAMEAFGECSICFRDV